MRSSNIATKLVSVNAKFAVSISLAGASPETASAFAASLLADASAGKRKKYVPLRVLAPDSRVSHAMLWSKARKSLF
ncbi:uncharacterized protein QC764_708588 [Podospora pseudoanserina]|uniref:Uncharacterized protein n=1 Tax=Podospora pseudoanserina TaxID=2609844 RepID=A0ABR0HKZ1_9PEZI|nr:hypothetical protein QC764_708588 [Podospora pseudoanserina]